MNRYLLALIFIISSMSPPLFSQLKSHGKQFNANAAKHLKKAAKVNIKLLTLNYKIKKFITILLNL